MKLHEPIGECNLGPTNVFAEVTDVFPKLGLWVTWEFMKELTMRRMILDHMVFSPYQS